VPDAQSSDLAGRRILVVEDEYAIATELAWVLRQHGAEVVGPAPSVARALALIDAGPPLDGAILDLNLGGEASYPVADALAARATPFVFTTGYDAVDVPARYRDVPCLGKPFDDDALVRALARRA
jgi:CheY-like chemotaxis protein